MRFWREMIVLGLCLLSSGCAGAEESRADQITVIFKTEPPETEIFRQSRSGKELSEIGSGGDKIIFSRQSDFGNGAQKVELVFKAPGHGTRTETLDLASVENLRGTDGYFPREIRLEPQEWWPFLKALARRYPVGIVLLSGVALIALKGFNKAWEAHRVRSRHRELGGNGTNREFAGFVFLNVLGEGATSKVWRCCRKEDFIYFDKAPEILVFKEISTNFQSHAKGKSEFEARFRREVETLEKCQHPNIVGLVEAGIDEPTQRAYIVMEEAKGEPIEARMERNEVLSLTAFVSIAGQLCSALQHMHDLGVIHRDIKPANVMITDKNIIRVVDLGIAKSVEEVEALTRAGIILGTPRYLPKWLLGFDNPDKAWDQYASAVMLTELIGGERLVEYLKAKGGQSTKKAFSIPFEVQIPVPNETFKILGKVVGSWDSDCLYPSMDDFFRALEESAGDRAKGSGF